MLGGVFICYRREDSGGFAGRIYDRLTTVLGSDNVFFDVDSIAPGVDFVDMLSERVGRCDALVVVIGRHWLSTEGAGDRRRIDDPNDYVRIEIEAALRRGIRVIPVLVDGAVLPKREDLPPSLTKLTRRQGIEVSHARFDSDVERLNRALSELEEELGGDMAAAGGSVLRGQGAAPQMARRVKVAAPAAVGAAGAAAPAATSSAFASPAALFAPARHGAAGNWRGSVPVIGAILGAGVIVAAALIYGGGFSRQNVVHPWKPSYDCRLASFKSEFMICDNEQLSQLDNQLSTIYLAVRKSLAGDDQKELDTDESLWVAERNTCDNFNCIRQKYDERIAALKTAMSNKR